MRSIIAKLQREKSRLTQLQDIGGCRAVVDDVDQAHELVRRLKRSRMRHELVKVDDYLTAPKATGYRGIHLVYRHRNPLVPSVDGLLCEIQVRTRQQHAWACTVEAAGFFRGEDLKSGLGNTAWLRLFALAGQMVAIRENSPRVPGTPDDYLKTRAEAHALIRELDVVNWLHGFAYPLRTQKWRKRFKDAYWYLLVFNSETGRMKYVPYTAEDTAAAFDHYRQEEQQGKDKPNIQVVLVSAEDLSSVREGYPSFFGNLREFRRALSEVLDLHMVPPKRAKPR